MLWKSVNVPAWSDTIQCAAAVHKFHPIKSQYLFL